MTSPHSHTSPPELQLGACPACGSHELDFLLEVGAQMQADERRFRFERCAECELVMLNPRLPLEELERYYPASYLPYRGRDAWGKYGSFIEQDQMRLDQRRLDVLKQVCELSTESRLWDIGCGKPSFLELVQSRIGLSAMGIDFSDHGWRGEAEKYASLELLIGDVQDMDLENQAAPDIITMWHYLEHDYAPQRTLRRLAELSKPSTRLIFEVPDYDSDSRRRYGEYWAGWHAPRHTFLYSPPSIRTLLENHGWEIIELRRSGTLSDYLLYWMSEMEVKDIDWTKDMAEEFWAFGLGFMRFKVRNLFAKKDLPRGIMLVVARPKGIGRF